MQGTTIQNIDDNTHKEALGRRYWFKRAIMHAH